MAAFPHVRSFHQHSPDFSVDALPTSRTEIRRSYSSLSNGSNSITDRQNQITYEEELPNPRPSSSEQGQALQKYAKWGVKWHRQPMYMVLFALTGALLALGHHFFYKSLNGTVAGSDRHQQWAHTFGNVFAVLVVTTLAAADKAAYHQYFWTIVREKSFTLGVLDKLFSLTSDPLGFFSLELFKSAPVAAALALICWCITIAGLFPPGSLTIIQGTVHESSSLSIALLNWRSTSWSDPSAANRWPSTIVLDLATQTAAGMNILKFEPPALNSSYNVEITGPFLQCQTPNATQIPVFEFYETLLANGSGEPRITEWSQPYLSSDTLEAGNFMNVMMSTFDPYLGSDGWANFPGLPDQFNSWPVSLPANFSSSIGYEPEFLKANPICNPSVLNFTTMPACQMFPRQLWVLTSNDSFVCTLGNGTRIAQFSFEDGTQTVSYGDLTSFIPLFVPRTGVQPRAPPNWDSDFPSTLNESAISHEVYAYMAAYVSLTSMLSGNITAFLEVEPENPQVELWEHTSRITFTGLDACSDFQNNYWNEKYPNAASLFPKPEYMCRNRTLARGIEDLMTNITLSMMTSSNLTSSNATNVTLITSLSHNIYKYNPFYLLLSYSIALGFTTFSIFLGLYAFHCNGVSHSTSFSAIIATTRNPALAKLSEGHSLGNFPLDGKMSKVKMIFGAFMINGKGEDQRIRAGFRTVGDSESGVFPLTVGGKYV